MQHTLILIKPDGVKKGLVGQVIARFEQKGLRLAGMKMVRLNDQLLDTWYAHHKDKPFFDALKQFMRQTPLVAVLLEGKDAVAKVRHLCGPTNSKVAPPGTIRGDWGKNIQENIIHAANSVVRAQEEIKMLFKKEEVFKY